MRILHWTERFWPHIGGIEILSQRLIETMRSRNYDVEVVTSHSGIDLPDHDVFNDIPIHRFHMLTSLMNRNLKQMMDARRKIGELKARFKPDLVHMHFSGPGSFFHKQTSSAYPGPTLMTIHSLPPGTNEKSTLAIDSIRSATWINTVSASMLHRIEKLVPDRLHRMSVILNGVPLPELKPAPLPFDPPCLLCLGRLVDWKGFDTAVTVFASLRKRFPNLRLVIAGDGPEKGPLERLATKLAVRDRVEFTGWVEPNDVPELINRATTVLIPSRDSGGETLPVVALQASQMARPIIASRIAGLPEIVEHEKTGLLVTPDDVDGLAEGIACLLEKQTDAMNMGKAARQKVQDEFGMDSFIDSYDRLYQQLIQEFSQNPSL